MTQTRDWQRNREMWVRVLERQTGTGIDGWNRRIGSAAPRDEAALREWLSREGVKGYAQTLLVMERFGYPDFLLASADQLIERQYADRMHLRPIFDALVSAANGLENVAIQTRKTYVSLVTPVRTFARIVPATKQRIDLGLRLDGKKPGGRLAASTIHETMKLQISLTSVAEVDEEVLEWLGKAHERNS
jgi:hypothetical protein